MQMIVGLIVLVLLALGVWWFMGSGTPAQVPVNTNPPATNSDLTQ